MEQENNVSQHQHPLQKPLFLVTAAIVFSGILVAGAILFSGTFPKSSDSGEIIRQEDQLEKQPKNAGGNGRINVSLDDDPVLGDKTKAKIAIVEWSDYECPFCKKFHQETFDKLVKEYVDTGKVVIAFRDFPLSFHEPMATKEASAANCVQKLFGDKAYFDYGALLFANTGTNGKGMSDEKMEELVAKTGVGRDDFRTCVKENDFGDEIVGDQVDGEDAGVSGTPAFIVGKLNADGMVTDGVKLVGAQPIDSFRKVIDAQLK